MTTFELEDGDPGTAFAPVESVKDQGAQPRTPGCGGCAGLGAHYRACPVAVGPDASRYYRWAAALDDIGDSVGPNDMAASNHIWSAASLLRAKAKVEAARYQGKS